MPRELKSTPVSLNRHEREILRAALDTEAGSLGGFTHDMMTDDDWDEMEEYRAALRTLKRKIKATP